MKHEQDISKLRAADILTIGGVLMSQRKDLLAIKGLSDGKVNKILEAGTRMTLFTESTGTAEKSEPLWYPSKVVLTLYH